MTMTMTRHQTALHWIFFLWDRIYICSVASLFLFTERENNDSENFPPQYLRPLHQYKSEIMIPAVADSVNMLFP